MKLPRLPDLLGLKTLENTLTQAISSQLEANKLLTDAIAQNEKRVEDLKAQINTQNETNKLLAEAIGQDAKHTEELEARVEGLETGAQDHYAKVTQNVQMAREVKVQRAQTRTDMINELALLSDVPEQTIKEAVARFNISDGMLAAGYKLVQDHPEKIEEIKKRLGLVEGNGGSASPSSSFMYG